MKIILVISRQQTLAAEIKKAALPAADSYHIEQLTPPFSYPGYFPENHPSYIFIDSASLTDRTTAGLYRIVHIKFPETPVYICHLITSPPDIAVLRNTFFMPYNAISDLAGDFFNILTANLSPVMDIPKEKFFSMEMSHGFFMELVTPETVFPIRYKYSGCFSDYQFFVCLYEDCKKSTSARTNFYEFYEKLSEAHPRCLAYQAKPRVLAVIFYDTTNHLTEFINFRIHLLELSQQYGQNYGNESLQIQSGCIHSGLMGLTKSYYEAAETAYINKLVKKSTSFEEISALSIQLIKPLNIIELERRIRNNMEYRNGENVVQYVRLWFKEYARLDYSMENIQMDLLNLYASIKYVIFDMYTLREPRIKRGWEVYELFKIETVEALEEWFCTWVCYTLNNVHSKQDSQQMRIHDALGFIENHLMENISLETVANYFFLNPSYFSTLFKKEMNETFISYVTRMKMEKAAELLKGDRSVSEVAALLGYDDLRHFRTLFKKQYNALPSEYKKQYKNADN